MLYINDKWMEWRKNYKCSKNQKNLIDKINKMIETQMPEFHWLQIRIFSRFSTDKGKSQISKEYTFLASIPLLRQRWIYARPEMCWIYLHSRIESFWISNFSCSHKSMKCVSCAKLFIYSVFSYNFYRSYWLVEKLN